MMLWQLRDQDPLPTCIKGRTVLIGDAAHAMTPQHGQGGTQAVQDTKGFKLFYSSGLTLEALPAKLRDFDVVRRPRASQIQDNTRKLVGKRSLEELERFDRCNRTYPKIVEGSRRVNVGRELTQFQDIPTLMHGEGDAEDQI